MMHQPNHPPAGLSEVADGMAHEFNNLLGAIQSFADLIVEDMGKDSLAGRHATRIIDASRCGLRLVEQTAVISGCGKVCRRPIDLSNFVEDVAAEFAAVSPAQLRLRAERHSAGVMVHADRNLLRRALLELCANAAESLGGCGDAIDLSVGPANTASSIDQRLPTLPKNAFSGGVDVFQNGDAFWAVGGKTICDPAEWVSVVVADTGTGMGGDVLGRAFAPFFTTRDRALHSGLGLSVVLGVATAHGGAVVIDTAPGRGTTAQMVLPLLAA